MSTNFFFRQRWFTRLASVLSMIVMSGAALAQSDSFPNRPIRIIYPFATGTGGDIIVRAVAQKISEQTRQPVIVDNRVGAGGIIGAVAAAKAPADGYTLLMGVSPLTIAPAMDSNAGYDPLRDFVPIAKVATAPLVLTVNSALPVNSIPELVAYAKANPKKLSYGSSGPGTSAQIEMELFKQAAGVEILEVPYKSTPQLMTDLMGGQISMYSGVIALLLPHIRSGRIKAIGLLDSRRTPLLPDTPTLAEGLGQPGYVATPNWYGFLAPTGVPPEIVAKLATLIKDAMRSPEVKNLLIPLGAELITPSNEQFSRDMKAELEKTARIAKALGIAK